MSQNIKDFLPPDWELVKEHDLAKPVQVASDVVDKSDQEFQVIIGLMSGIMLALTILGALFFWGGMQGIPAVLFCLIVALVFWAFYRASSGEEFDIKLDESDPSIDLGELGPNKVGTDKAGTSLYP